MSYKLDFDADFASAARVAARERLDKGAATLSEEQDDDPSVPCARPQGGQGGALTARLAEPGLRKRTYRRENRRLRDAARTVAHARDADVMVETIDALRERFAARVPARTFTDVRRRLAKDGRRSRANANGTVGVELTETLEAVSRDVVDRPLDGRWAPARKGVARTYKRGRKAFAASDAELSADNLHELRKRVKDLWYQVRLLKPRRRPFSQTSGCLACDCTSRNRRRSRAACAITSATPRMGRLSPRGPGLSAREITGLDGYRGRGGGLPERTGGA